MLLLDSTKLYGITVCYNLKCVHFCTYTCIHVTKFMSLTLYVASFAKKMSMEEQKQCHDRHLFSVTVFIVNTAHGRTQSLLRDKC